MRCNEHMYREQILTYSYHLILWGFLTSIGERMNAKRSRKFFIEAMVEAYESSTNKFSEDEN